MKKLKKLFEEIVGNEVEIEKSTIQPSTKPLVADKTEPINFTKHFMNAGRAFEKDITEEKVNQEELQMGIRIEYEHTNHYEIAKRIALDHLAELPDYYTRLVRMEEEGKKALGEQK